MKYIILSSFALVISASAQNQRGQDITRQLDDIERKLDDLEYDSQRVQFEGQQRHRAEQERQRLADEERLLALPLDEDLRRGKSAQLYDSIMQDRLIKHEDKIKLARNLLLGLARIQEQRNAQKIR